MKKFLAFLLVLVAAFVLVGCKKANMVVKDNLRQIKVTLNSQNKKKITMVYKTESKGKVSYKEVDPKDLTFETSKSGICNINANGEIEPLKNGFVDVKVTNKKTKQTVIVKVVVRTQNADYPDLNGYTIKIAQADHALHEVDPRMEGYNAPDKEAKQKAWAEVEDLFNCKIEVVGYPSSAPWGKARWDYIKNQAQSKQADYDFYIVPEPKIPEFVQAGAILDLTDFYAKHGNAFMNKVYEQSGTYKSRLYNINGSQPGVDNGLFMNMQLFNSIKSTLTDQKSPAELYLEGKWTFSRFEQFLKEAQAALDQKFGPEVKAKAATGNPVYYWVGLCNAAGVTLVNPQTAKVDLQNEICGKVADFLKKLVTENVLENVISVDQHDKTWNEGHSLIASGDMWFLNTPNRWPSNLWGSDTQFGYVPYPRPDKKTVNNVETDTTVDDTGFGISASTAFVMPAHRKFEGDFKNISSEQVYQAIVQTFILTEQKKQEMNITATELNDIATRKFGGDKPSTDAFIDVSKRMRSEVGPGQAFFEGLASPANPIFNTGDTVSANNKFTKALFYYVISKQDDTDQELINSNYGELIGKFIERFNKLATDVYA